MSSLPTASPSPDPAHEAPTASLGDYEAPAGLPAEVKTEYEAAKDAVGARDYEEAQAHLERAVELLPDFTEGWYNLGATYSRLAIRAVQESGDQEALAHFQRAVDAKRKARDLMDQGRWYVYFSEAQQSQVRSDVEKALEDADAVVADEASLLAALRLWASAEAQ